MKYNPFKIIIWVLVLVFVLLNSIRLFIYGFVISFIIVIIDRAFFGTRKRSDTQFLNLFLTFTSIFTLFYTFSPFFRSVEFKISHPRWEKLEIVSVDKETSKKVSTSFNFLEKAYTSIRINYLDDKGEFKVKTEEIKHYAILGFEPLIRKDRIEKELDYIHNRSLNKLIDKKAINLYQHPSKEKMKIFKGNDAFALRHSVGFQIALLITYFLFVILNIYCIFKFKQLVTALKSSNTKDQKTAYIILIIVLYSYLVVGITFLHYLKF